MVSQSFLTVLTNRPDPSHPIATEKQFARRSVKGSYKIN